MTGNSIVDRRNRQHGGSRALQPLPPGLARGSLIAVRGSRWRITAAVERVDCCELHLQGSAGETRVLLWPFDRPAAIATAPRSRVMAPQRWVRNAARAMTSTFDPVTPRGRFNGALLPYQLEPAIAVASGASRVVLADEVGLGKTIQAGWILADLREREIESRALVAVPASLREQWASELEALFALAAQRVDAGWLRATVADRAADVSPWAAPGVYLGSIDFLKRPDVAAALAEVPWDLLVVDEAHTATAPTERHAALASIAAVSRRVTIITATPYSGDAAAFASMTALGAMRGDGPPLMFRRSREEVGDPRVRRHRFAMVRVGAIEARLQRLLDRYTRAVWQQAPGEIDAARLAMTVLRKRALSSPAAAARSLARRLELLGSAPARPRQLSLFDDSAEQDEALPDSALATPGLADTGLEARWLAVLVAAAGAAGGQDSKLRYLLRLIARVNGEPVIVFTEYRDTLRQLAGALPGALQLHGGLTGSERASVQRRFNDTGGVLLATDAAADGLNLQRRCRLLVNYELPWNPARLEQRIGRVDRIGQRRRVHAVSLVARDTAEDLVVAALARRLVRVSTTLGERDRLAALLTDARTARAVITGTAAVAADDTPQAPPLPRPAAGQYRADGAAAQIRAGAANARAGGFVAASRVRGGRAIPGGAVAVVHARAVNDRGIVAQGALLVHVSEALCPTAPPGGDVRAAASRVSEVIAAAGASIDAIVHWFARASALHRTALLSRIARERAIHDAAVPRSDLQPGLFDRRAIAGRERADHLVERVDEDRLEQQRRLAASLDVRLECSTAAVLTIWP